MTLSLPEPTDGYESRALLLRGYLDFYRSRILEKVMSLPETEARSSRLRSAWTPVELVKHLTFVEMRWLDWGFEGLAVDEPWGDERHGRWYVSSAESTADVMNGLRIRAEKTGRVIAAHSLDEVGQPGPRWNGAAPPTLERVLLHLVQEFARHLGQLDIVTEIATGSTGE
jgi:uncharacterized damage-inducible protein DinB